MCTCILWSCFSVKTDKESGNQEPVSDNKDKSTDNQTEAKGAGVSSANQGKNQDQVQPDASVIECLLSKKRNATKRKVYVTLTPILCNCILTQLIFLQYLIRKAAKEAKVYGRKSFSDLKPVVRKYILDRVCVYVYFLLTQSYIATKNGFDLRSVIYVCVSGVYRLRNNIQSWVNTRKCLTEQCQESCLNTNTTGVKKDVVMWYVRELIILFIHSWLYSCYENDDIGFSKCKKES